MHTESAGIANRLDPRSTPSAIPNYRAFLRAIIHDSGTKHNFTVSQQTVDADLDPKGKAQVTVTIPSSGVLQFFCEYHTGRGMNGELLAGSAAPQAPPAASPKPASSSRSSDYGY